MTFRSDRHRPPTGEASYDTGYVFEEILSHRLGRLYAGALFVTGDRQDDAESLLVAAVEAALERHFRGEDPAVALDRALIDEAMRDAEPATRGAERPLIPTPAMRRALDRVDPAAVRRAALDVPMGARLAIWLVVVERRTYEETAGLLDVTLEGLTHLLAWRDTMVTSVLIGSGKLIHRARSGS